MPIAMRCPFILQEHKSKGKDRKFRIICECGRLEFPNKIEYNLFINRYCANAECWKTCTLAKSLSEFYERSDIE